MSEGADWYGKLMAHVYAFADRAPYWHERKGRDRRARVQQCVFKVYDKEQKLYRQCLREGVHSVKGFRWCEEHAQVIAQLLREEEKNGNH